MAYLLGYCRLVTAINRALAGLAATLVFVMVAVIAYEVVARYFFNAPTVWALELSTLLLGPYFMLAGPYVLHIGGHVNVDVLYARLPPRIAAVVDCISYPLIMVLCVIVLRESWPLARDAYLIGETSFSAWNAPVWPVKMIIPLVFVLLMLQALAETIAAGRRALNVSRGAQS